MPKNTDKLGLAWYFVTRIHLLQSVLHTVQLYCMIVSVQCKLYLHICFIDCNHCGSALWHWWRYNMRFCWAWIYCKPWMFSRNWTFFTFHNREERHRMFNHMQNFIYCSISYLWNSGKLYLLYGTACKNFIFSIYVRIWVCIVACHDIKIYTVQCYFTMPFTM